MSLPEQSKERLLILLESLSKAEETLRQFHEGLSRSYEPFTDPADLMLVIAALGDAYQGLRGVIDEMLAYG
jgi:hypothetical protein